MVETIIICVTAVVIACIVCYTFGPTEVEPEIKYVEVPTSAPTQEDDDAENALVTALGEINNLFGGVADED